MKSNCFSRFPTIIGKSIFKFFNKNALKTNSKGSEIKEGLENKDLKNIKDSENIGPKDKNNNISQPSQPSPNTPPVNKESKINQYFRDNVKKYDGRLN